MLVAGDERWRTQRGNNNAYVQDNPVSWLDWRDTEESDDLLTLARTLLGLRRSSPVLRQPAFFEGRPVAVGDGCKDLAWFNRDGQELTERDWFDAGLRTIGMYLDGRGLRHRDGRGRLITDDSYLLVLHAGDAGTSFRLPGKPWAAQYEVVIDTAQPSGHPKESATLPAGQPVTLSGRTSLLLRVRRG
jgi:glycogen operon protein